MSDPGKGSHRRKAQVPDKKVTKNWKYTFRKKEKKSEKPNTVNPTSSRSSV